MGRKPEPPVPDAFDEVPDDWTVVDCANVVYVEVALPFLVFYLVPDPLVEAGLLIGLGLCLGFGGIRQQLRNVFQQHYQLDLAQPYNLF